MFTKGHGAFSYEIMMNLLEHVLLYSLVKMSKNPVMTFPIKNYNQY